MSMGLKQLAVLVSVLGIVGCEEWTPVQLSTESPVVASPEIGASVALEREVSFEFDFTAQLEKEVIRDTPTLLDDGTDNTPGFQAKALSPDILTGIMIVENIETGVSETHPWSILVGENYFQQPDSFNTVTLRPGNYTFILSVVNGEQQYVGTTFHSVQEDSPDLVPMAIRPVIGDSIVDVTIENSLVELGFNYSPAEIAAAGLLDPVVVISVDGGPEQHFFVNPITGLSEGMYMALAPGNYDLAIKLYDGGFLIGKSVVSQDLVTVSLGLDLNLDIVPLYGEMQIELFAEDTDADVVVQVPTEVVDEVGGVGNLEAFLRVVGPNIPYYEFPLVLAQVGAGYAARVTLPNMIYDDLTFEMTFFDLSRGREVGNCISTAPNTLSGTTVTCPVMLQSTASIGGGLLSTVGVNVFDLVGFPVAGAVLKIDGVEAGITANTSFGTAGYSKLFVKPGEHVISAQFASEYGEVLYNAIPLDVTNINVMMGETVNVSTPLLVDDFSGLQTGIAAPTDYWFGCIGLGESQGGAVNNESFVLWSHYTDMNNNYCSSTSAVTQRSFTNAEIIDAGGFQVSVDALWLENVNSELTIGVGEEPGLDPQSYVPSATADADVTVRDYEIEVNIYDAGILGSKTIHAMPFTAAQVENLKVDVETNSFAPGAPAMLRVYVNDNPNFVSPTAFNWDGGGNHIELRGGAGDPAFGNGGWIELDNLVIRPR